MQKSTLDFAPLTPGVIICEAINPDGKTEARANVIANSLDGDLTILNANNMPIVVGDVNVSVICEGSAIIYTEIDWFKGDKLITKATRMCSVQ